MSKGEPSTPKTLRAVWCGVVVVWCVAGNDEPNNTTSNQVDATLTFALFREVNLWQECVTFDVLDTLGGDR
jgi:hypothetical protein